jgi:hypothetical protein
MKRLDRDLATRQRDSFSGEAIKEHGLRRAEELLRAGAAQLHLDLESLHELPKLDVRKRALAWWLRTRTTVSNKWVTDKLQMGHFTNVSSSVSRIRNGDDAQAVVWRRKLERLA